ncbi:MAG: cell division protein ZipA [Cycloclasticus sp. symbiont of Bathymodiolus heckerae]|nr:MAG: cell division protein ZipA [Cycloclasticus sp. symbiont of Bathymodiolus heckerae]
MEENSLRLILLVVGVIILLGIYFYDVLKKRKNREEESFDASDEIERVEPVIKDEKPFSAVYDEKELPSQIDQKESGASVRSVEEIPVAEPAFVVQLAIIPVKGDVLSGSVLLSAFTRLGLEFGDMGIFHCYERQNGIEKQRFHVANLLEPGTFPVGSMGDFESTGIILFFQATDSVEATASFDSMLTVSQQLSQTLEATLVGADMSELTLEKISDIQAKLSDLSD